MKRLLFMISSMNGGGAERVISTLANSFCRQYPVAVVLLFPKKDIYSLDSGVTVFRFTDHLESQKLSARIQRRLPGFLARWLYVRSVKRTWKPDTTISMLPTQNLLNILCGGHDRKILSERNDPTKKGRLYQLEGKFCYSRADHVVFQSEHVRGMFSNSVQRKSSVIRNPIQVGISAADHREKRIVTVGRLHPQKNHRILIEAFARFHSTHPEYTLDIYGDGPLRRELREQIHSLGLDSAVTLKGFLHTVHEDIRTAQMFVLSSDYEGLSNALLEAMSMGIACISTTCAGSTEVLQNEVSGLLVPIGDAAALQAAMEKLADDPALRIDIEKQARIFSEGFASDRILAEWKELL